MSGLHFHPLRVRDVRPEADDACVITFDVSPQDAEAFRFAPGQYLTLRDPRQAGDLRRSYSVCAAAGDELRVGVRRVPGGAVSEWLHAHVRAGDTLDVMEPQGRFGAALALRGRAPRHILAVAGGSGITPILSIIKTVLGDEPKSRVTLLYGNRTLASTMFKEELEDLKNRFLTRFVMHPVFSREQMDAPLSMGRLDGEKITTLLRLIGAGSGAGTIDQVFICGPHAMNDEAEAALKAAGIDASRIHVERFGVPGDAADPGLHAPREGDAAAAQVTVVRDGLTREVAFRAGDASILAAAARAGLDLPFSCTSGVCATCRCKLLEGEVRMVRNFALEADDLKAGFILSCQAHPLTERVVVSFDER